MTVSYQYDVASSSTGGFFRLLWRWRGSIWKLLYKELLLFVAVYICIAFTYDFLMPDHYKRYYEHIVVFCSAFVEVIPLSFILGFYVSFTAHRWWQQYTAIPWPDKLMNIIALYIPGNDVTSRVLRRTLMRYLNLTLVLVLRSISIPVKRRFPTKEHLVEAGFMSRPELEIYQSVPSHEFNTFWIPCTWFVNLLREAKSECRITDSGGIKLIMEEFNEFRSKCGLLWSYDWVSIPLVYTQVVTLSTQAFFLASLLGRQHINTSHDIKSHIYGEYYIPIFTMLQFILYMGLLKLGEQLINPFGDDDEDFELNWIIDRHLKVSFLGVDILNSDPPPLIKDNYFDDTDIKLPYTEAAVAHKVKTYRGSVAAFHVPTEKHGLVIPEFEDENGESSDDDPSTIQSNRDAVARNNSWSLFGQRKRKLSSSLDSFNSETMVETGLSESEMPELVESNSSWPTFLQTEQQQHTALNRQSTSSQSLSKLSVWPMNKLNEKANEDTQGIRWSDTGQQQQSSGKADSSINIDNQQQQPTQSEQQQQSAAQQKASTLFKQPTLSTSDPSIAIQLGETTDQWTGSSFVPKLFRPRKHLPLQVFSKELANAPISVFNQILESNLNVDSRSALRSSLTSLSSQRFSTKPQKSLIKSQRQLDPKLRIRPFRSKVTFSDDIKSDDNKLRIRSDKLQYGWDSSSESNSSLLKTGQEHEQQKRIRKSPSRHMKTGSESKGLHVVSLNEPISFAENCKRRQSFDPGIYREKPMMVEEEKEKENWLHYQSLPNIQEDDDPQQQQQQGPMSPLDTAIPGFELKKPSPLASGTSNTQTHSSSFILQPSKSHQSPSSNVLLAPPPILGSVQTITTTTPTTSTTTTIAPTSATSALNRKRSFKRQKSQEIPDEDLKARLSQPQPTARIIKQSSDDSQASSNSSIKGIMPPSILRKRKEDLKQASTESDTGSYHTVKSLVMHASSSIDSFTSAVSESATNGNANNNNTNGTTNATKPLVPPTVSSITPTIPEQQEPITSIQDDPALAESRLLSYHSTIESTLVPKIIFSQSTPSVTSQSSDDQNSPKWDEGRYSEFSSVETVTENSLINRNSNNNDPIKSNVVPTISICQGMTTTTATTSSTSSSKIRNVPKTSTTTSITPSTTTSSTGSSSSNKASVKGQSTIQR